MLGKETERKPTWWGPYFREAPRKDKGGSEVFGLIFKSTEKWHFSVPSLHQPFLAATTNGACHALFVISAF